MLFFMLEYDCETQFVIRDFLMPVGRLAERKECKKALRMLDELSLAIVLIFMEYTGCSCILEHGSYV
jgi:hypothetical protein